MRHRARQCHRGVVIQYQQLCVSVPSVDLSSSRLLQGVPRFCRRNARCSCPSSASSDPDVARRNGAKCVATDASPLRITTLLLSFYRKNNRTPSQAKETACKGFWPMAPPSARQAIVSPQWPSEKPSPKALVGLYISRFGQMVERTGILSMANDAANRFP
jgi:hypothetical protein